jgi:ATP synthase protein I
METENKNRLNEFEKKVGKKEQRRIKAQKSKGDSPWLGFSMFGLIGWSVAVPTLLGAMLGLWLDENHPGSRSWTLMLLITGLMLGCFNAWYWVKKENNNMHEEDENKNQ